MYKIGLSTDGGKELLGKAFLQECKDNNIACVEIACPVDMIFTFDYETFCRDAKDYGVTVWSFHLPFLEHDISNLNEEARNNTVDYFETIIKTFSNYGVYRYIVHSSFEPIEDADRASKMAAAKISLKQLAEIAAKYDSVISVEDLPRTCLGRNADEILELISVDDRLSVCFDLNHLLSETQAEFIGKIGEKIETLHVSDYDFVNERHWLPGEGKIDWQSVMAGLKKVGYKGPWLYELAFACPKSIIRDRDLCCEDFERNANEIFEGKPLTVFSKQKENLGYWG